jgi:TolA-binding protein
MKEASDRADRKNLVLLYNDYTVFLPDRQLPDLLQFHVGKVFFDKKGTEKAETVFRLLIDQGEDMDIIVRAMFYLARIKAEMTYELNEARILFEQIIDKHPDHPWAESAREKLASIPKSPPPVQHADNLQEIKND